MQPFTMQSKEKNKQTKRTEVRQKKESVGGKHNRKQEERSWLQSQVWGNFYTENQLLFFPEKFEGNGTQSSRFAGVQTCCLHLKHWRFKLKTSHFLRSQFNKYKILGYIYRLHSPKITYCSLWIRLNDIFIFWCTLSAKINGKARKPAALMDCGFFASPAHFSYRNRSTFSLGKLIKKSSQHTAWQTDSSYSTAF